MAAVVRLEAICDTPFWDNDATWNTTTPAFTPCFTDTALTWVPALFLYLNVPYLLYEHSKSKRKPLSTSRFNYIKSLIIALNGAISAFQIAYLSYLWSQNDFPISKAEILSSCIYLLTNVVLLVLVHLQRRFGFINGGAIWFYFLLKIIATGLCIPTYLHYSDHKNFVQLIIIFITLGIEIILLLICSFADEPPPSTDQHWRSWSLSRPLASQAKLCPKEVASFTSKLTFWWYNKIIFTGFRKDLTRDDLWAIRSHDKAANIFEHFNRFWRHKQFKKESDDKKPDHLIRNEAFRNASFKDEISDYFTTSSPSNGHNNKGNKKNSQDKDDDSRHKGRKPFTTNPKTNVVFVIFQQFGKYFFLPCAARFVTDIVNLANPIVMKYLITFTTDPSAPAWHGFFYSAIFVLTNISSSLTSAYQQHRMAVLGMRIRTALMSAIYRKSLVLAAHSKSSYTTGEIVNLCAVDSQRFIDLLPWICFLWTAPVQIVIAIYLLWTELGYSVMGGLLLMILFIPIQGWAMNFVKRIQAKQMELKDRRLKAITEMLNGMKVLKLYAWEEAIVRNIEEIRSQELHYIRMSGYVTTIFNLIAYTSPFMVTCLTFTLYIFFGGEGNYLTAEKAFVSVALFNMLRVPLAQIPNMATSLMLVMVALKRLNNFLGTDETTDYLEKATTTTTTAGQHFPTTKESNREAKSRLKAAESKQSEDDLVPENAVELKNATFTWGRATDPTSTRTLTNISLAIPKGSLVAVVGSVGSGKSSLLYALLGEMEKVGDSAGVVAIAPDQQKLAYVAQQAWIQNATVRDNILFGKKYSPDKYNKVIEACALKPDLAMLSAGDATEIGEKGINLSGGQKQRISIARACYSQAALYLFDDPLSAVDSHVGRHIFEQVLDSRTGLLRNRTRILVTNALYMLPHVDQIVLLKNGHVEAVGTYEALMADTPVFSDLIANYHSNSANLDPQKLSNSEGGDHHEEGIGGGDTDQHQMMMVEEDEHFLEAGVVPDETRAMLGRTFSITSGLTLFSTRERHNSIGSSPSMLLAQQQQGQTKHTKTHLTSAYEELKAKSKLVEAEKMESGTVTFAVYRKFFASLGFTWSAAIVFLYFMMVVSSYGANFWLSHWTDTMADQVPGSTEYEKDTRLNLLFYFLIGATQFLFVICGWLSIIRGTIRASTNLHAALISSIVHAPMWFFDTTPLGRIVNRFSKDIDVLDTAMAMLIRILMNHSFNVLATMFTVSVQTPLFLAVVIPFLIIYGLIQRFYVATTRQLKRLESVSRSPIFTHFSETISGVSTIRAYQATERFIAEADSRIDANTAAFYPNAVANCWLQVRLEMMAALLTFFAAIFAVLGKNTGGGIGLSLSYALNMTLALNMCVRMYAELDCNIVSVERISEYTSVAPEAPWYREADEKLSPDWPEVGRLCFEAYGTRYRPGLDLVLRSVDLTTTRAEKIGIVGRTGAGKSSLTLALFRLIEAATGRIWMDGIDISTLGLQTLRSRITIIPQEPILFCGTIRQNLDPFGHQTDDQLWRVLELAHLKPFINSLGNGLSHVVSEGGENLSVGQRQLICLARALLRKTNVLVLDEATAAVDLETDSLIQSTIRAQFAHCTIFTIAHRLNTIMDSDRVLVLDAGNVAEFDSPANLFADSSTIFYSLAKDAGII